MRTATLFDAYVKNTERNKTARNLYMVGAYWGSIISRSARLHIKLEAKLRERLEEHQPAAVREVIEVMRILLDKGTWFISAIELDGFDMSTDGEDLEERARAALAKVGEA